MQGRNFLEKRYAEFHRLYAGDFRQDVALYLDLAAKYPGPVLEVGCGTGRVAAHLAAAGHEVHAIDISRPMLEVANSYLKPWSDRVQVYDFDLRNQPLAGRFSTAFVTLHHFNQLIDVEEQRLFLRHLRRSMSSPGVLALDLFCPVSLAQPEQAKPCREIERRFADRSLHVKDQREMLTPLLERRTQTYRIQNGPNGEWVTHRRFLPVTQAAQLLEEAGFEAIRCLENYDLSNARSVSDEDAILAPFMVIAEA